MNTEEKERKERRRGHGMTRLSLSLIYLPELVHQEVVGTMDKNSVVESNEQLSELNDSQC